MHVSRDDAPFQYCPNQASDNSHEDIPLECTTVMPRVCGMSLMYPLTVEPECNQGAVELGWPSHLDILLLGVTTPVPEGCVYAVTIYLIGVCTSGMSLTRCETTARSLDDIDQLI